jgi:hypothetical protein
MACYSTGNYFPRAGTTTQEFSHLFTVAETARHWTSRNNTSVASYGFSTTAKTTRTAGYSGEKSNLNGVVLH